jgi:hypothetical protein
MVNLKLAPEVNKAKKQKKDSIVIPALALPL